MTVDELIEEARKLPSADRELLMARLQDEFEPIDGPTDQIDEAWLHEVERRAAAVARGESRLIDHDDSIARLRKRLDDMPD